MASDRNGNVYRVRYVAVDRDGNLYLADEEKNRIRRVDPAGRISTFAGTGSGGFSGDGGLAVRAALRRTANAPSPRSSFTPEDVPVVLDEKSMVVALVGICRIVSLL